jgi:drug/metabolite transporter (DMT)-like permease
MAWVLGYESLLLKRAVGLVLGMIAIVLLVLPDHGLKSMGASFWILAVLLCAIFYSIENIYISEGVDDSVDV